MSTAPIDPEFHDSVLDQFQHDQRRTRVRAVAALVAIVALFAAFYVMLAQSSTLGSFDWAF